MKPLLCERCVDGREAHTTLVANGPCHLCGVNAPREMLSRSLATDERTRELGEALARARDENAEGPSVPPEVLRDLVSEVRALHAYVWGMEMLRRERTAPGLHEQAAIMTGGE